MKFWKGKTWIDWVKVIVAVDIAAVGIGLVFQQEVHILANLFGSISRLIFGVLYLIVAAAIFKGVFPDLFVELADEMTHETRGDSKQEDEVEPKETLGERIDKAAKKVDTFVRDRAKEASDEVKKVLE